MIISSYNLKKPVSAADTGFSPWTVFPIRNYFCSKKNLRHKSPGSSNKNKNFYFRKESAASCHCTSLSVLSYPYHILWRPFCQQKILAI